MQYTLDNLTEWTTSQNGASEEAMARQLEMFVDILQAQAGGPHGYRLRRIILTNFWLYGLQEFEIPHGRLFLAGENASGKSTVLTAALPLALDGDLRPNRLDTFGGRERHMEYYVLGGTESATPYSHERRTSYIALEFEWCDPDTPPIAPEIRQRWENGEHEKTRFLTIGVSLSGNINASDRIRPLRFLITDGSRLGYDLHTVYETGSRHDRRAFDHPRFKQQLEGHGIICDTQAEYERQVARYLFGFDDVKDFQKLINLLLVLRRPNLSSELSFSRVHDYLKQSLRKISGETTSHVIGTIERIDAIQAEKERVQEAYSAAERLHHSQESLALSRAQLAACEYLGTQLVEDSAQNRVNRLRRDLRTAENERARAEELTQTLQAEQYQVNGQIKVLEASEGLQVANRLASARERTRETQAQAQLQQQSLEAARQSGRASAESLERQQMRFDTMKSEGIAQVQELHSLAVESQWDVAAVQLEEAQRQVSSISTETSSAPKIPSAVASLLGEQSEERISWLHHLEELHRQREKLETDLQHARNLETIRFQELDHIRQRFQSIQDRFYEARLILNNTLEQFTSSESLQMPQESTLLQDDIVDDDALPELVVEQFAAVLNHYSQTIEALESQLTQAAIQAQAHLNDLQVFQGGKKREVEEIRALYEQKLAEPEFTPVRPERHTIARAKLAQHGISALPLYMLLDFTSEIDCESDEAGRIEAMLEDAGLLDALVVAPSQVALADELLATEGLSDCRLDIEGIGRLIQRAQPTTVPTEENSTNQQHRGHFYGLRFDASPVNASSEGNNLDWEPLVNTILTIIEQNSLPGSLGAEASRLSFHNDGTWTHGLLSGRAGGGAARCIGKTTRLRVRQRELAELVEKQEQLDAELLQITQSIARNEARLVAISEQQAQLRKALPSSGLEKIFAELEQSKIALDETRSIYQKARLHTQEARQHCNNLIARLERESNGIAAFAGDQKRVQGALLGVIQLKNQAQSLHAQLAGLIHTWEEYQKAKDARTQAVINESNVASLYERIRYQALQAQAEEEELQRIAEFSNAGELSERLQALRLQNETLTSNLTGARSDFIRADERASNAASQLAEAEERLQQAQLERGEKQVLFLNLLGAYPVEDLVTAQQLASESKYVAAAQKLSGGALREVDIPARKEQLETAYRDAYNVLSRTFNREQPILVEYGPDLDDQGLVVFLNENKCKAIELLELLSERIEMQEMLLNQEETRLFEDFLLHEIAEAIRTSIFEAEEWVQQINKVLSGLPMIGEHYSLQWKPPTEYDMTKLGSHLAQHYKLLRKPTQTLTAEETETLMSAFRQEIDSVRLRQQEQADMNFMDALEQVFDYREWFHFDVLVTPIGGQRQRLTDRVAGTRSGAEQLFALYVPLFAALGALYRSAAPGAPRLLALDEAFDKVSIANTQRIMEFLVSQDFQWIMTGPQISGTGAKIPACARYLMIHEKGSPIATASASFWSDNQTLALE
ncbi:MAG TPA: SbcC/MukB-like Walker B domain-containing protein [Ktedonobacteraceae bacterium]